VRSALRLLHDDGIVDPAERGGYTVLHTLEQLHDIASREDVDSDDELCLRVVADRLDGRLADRITENALTRQVWWAAASRSTHWLAVANSTRCPAWQARIPSPIARMLLCLVKPPWSGCAGLSGQRRRSLAVTGSPQCGQSPPGPRRRQKTLQSGHLCSPRQRCSHSGHW
jgi:hypothetical protein